MANSSQPLLGVFFFLLLSVFQATAQSDTLVTKRKIFTTDTYQNGKKLNGKQLNDIYSADKIALRKHTISKIMLPMGPPIAVGGFLLAYDGLKGEPRQTVINGKTIDYVERSLPKLLVGLAAFVTGVSFVEGANELKTNAAWHFTNQKKNKTAATLNLKAGVLSASNIGIRLDF